jgi:indolepyruvate ferredoxin oxidoreductase alpha subunit
MANTIKAVSRERSFSKAAGKLLLGDGEVFQGEAILATTKALLQSGVSYVGGYPGSPVSHLMDVLADAQDSVLRPLGIHFEQSASEAGAAALLGTSINYPLRGAVTWKSIVGTNVASDALSNLSSAGVIGGALIVVGDDYGEGASVIQERTLATAMKSSIPLIDPVSNVATIVDLSQHAFEMSEASRLPVMLSLRIRACHMTGSFVCRNNQPALARGRNAPLVAESDYNRIVLPPSTYAQEKAKAQDRLPAAERYIIEHDLNTIVKAAGQSFGIILQGGTHSAVMRALARLGAADYAGNSDVPLLILNVIHPLSPEQILGFMEDKDAVLVIEEGHPAFIEDQIRSFAHGAGATCRVFGKGMVPTTGEYVTSAVRAGIATFLEVASPKVAASKATAENATIRANADAAKAELKVELPDRPPGFCSGCPERPVFTALKMIERERGPVHVSMDIGCSTFATLPPFNIGNTVLGYGLSLASGGAIAASFNQPTIAVMGDGGFWHNGLSTGVINAQWQHMDAVLVILENGYASATGQQHLPSTGSTPIGEPADLSIEQAVRGVGVNWVKRVDSYDVEAIAEVLCEAIDARGPALRVIISPNECMLAKRRRGDRAKARALADKRPVRVARYGVDAEVCTGDRSCIRLNGCPSLTLRHTGDPLKDGPTTHIDQSCAACNLCGELVHAEGLCPSFYKAQSIQNAGPWQRLRAAINRGLLDLVRAT